MHIRYVKTRDVLRLPPCSGVARGGDGGGRPPKIFFFFFLEGEKRERKEKKENVSLKLSLGKE